MSKTFKTDPVWVKVQKNLNTPIVKEYHDHRTGPCDLDQYEGGPYCFWWQRRPFNCAYDVSYYGYHGGFYARPPHGRSYRQEYEGRMRAGWRKARQDMLKLSREDIEDYDVKSYQHRHSALWELY